MLAPKANRAMRIGRKRRIVLRSILTLIINKKLRTKAVVHQHDCYSKTKNKTNTKKKKKQQPKKSHFQHLLYYRNYLTYIMDLGDFINSVLLQRKSRLREIK